VGGKTWLYAHQRTSKAWGGKTGGEETGRGEAREKNPQRQKVLLELEVKSTSRKRWGVANGEPRISHGEAPGTPEGCEMEKGGALYPISRVLGHYRRFRRGGYDLVKLVRRAL
jgi:hypothetical protein